MVLPGPTFQSIGISWDASLSSVITYYEIFSIRGENAPRMYQGRVLPDQLTVFTVDGLNPNTLYSIEVSAVVTIGGITERSDPRLTQGVTGKQQFKKSDLKFFGNT